MGHLKMYFLLKMGIFQPAMLVYQREDGRPKPFPFNEGFFLIFVKGKLGKSDSETNNVSLDRWCNLYLYTYIFKYIYVNSIFLKIIYTYLCIYLFISAKWVLVANSDIQHTVWWIPHELAGGFGGGFLALVKFGDN